MSLLRALGAAVLLCTSMAAAVAAPYTEGTNYVTLAPTQATTVGKGKVEVLEVFSYACPACNGFQPIMERLKKVLPPNAQVAYLPAAFIPAEDWPMFQRAYFAAQLLGVADRTHQAMFDAVWKDGALATTDYGTHRLKDPLPSIEDAARWYAAHAGVKPDEFLAAARSFSVDIKMKAADAQIMSMQVPGTPCLIIDGRYRVINESVVGADQLIELVKFLVAKAAAAP